METIRIGMGWNGIGSDRIGLPDGGHVHTIAAGSAIPIASKFWSISITAANQCRLAIGNGGHEE